MAPPKTPARSAGRLTGARSTPRAALLWISIALVVITVAVYAPVRHFDFVKWDDPLYITENPDVLTGLTWHGAAWAFTTGHDPYWHPLTWLSHMLDVQLYGVNPGGHHTTNVLLHIGTTLLLFGFLYRTTAALAKSAFVAALFAVHPLHVESVAWIAERKDVLSALIWMLTLWAYAEYARRPGVARYLSVFALVACGLMAKPMAVTLPLALLLIDVWPLKRPLSSRLVVEKIPLVALSIASSLVTAAMQRRRGFLPDSDVIPPAMRVANALTSYVAYIGKAVWPARLAALYPYPHALPDWWILAGASLLLAGISVVAVRSAPRRPYLLVGWLWYLGTLVPVIGLVQSGEQSMANRFVYIPIVGLFLMVAWGLPDIFARWRHRRVALPAAAVVVILAFAIAARTELQYWTDNLTLWEHTAAVTSGNYRAEGNLAMALDEAGRVSDAISHYTEALRIKPDFVDAHDNLGLALANEGRLDEATAHYAAALRLEPADADAHNNLGKVLIEQGKTSEAIAHFSDAVRARPAFAEAQNNLANALASQERIDQAIQHYTEALRVKPDFADAHNGLAGALVSQGKDAEAIAHYLEAVRSDPLFAAAHSNLAMVLARHGRTDEAIHELEEALRIEPDRLDRRQALNALIKGR